MSKEFKPLPEQISDKMIASIKTGKSIFEKAIPNDMTSQFVQPFNPSTGKKYNGPAALILMMQDKADPRWMTANQASFNKTHVLKESKGTLINFFSNNVTQPVMKDGEQVKKENGYPMTERVTLDKPQLVDAWLFNGSQLNEMPEYKPEPQLLTPIERAQAIMDASKAQFEYGGMFSEYDRDTDTIKMPDMDAYEMPERFYATALHELAHWSAQEDRLNRADAKVSEENSWMKEELRTNLASVFISAELNLPYDPDGHTVFLAYWADLMKTDPKELFKAAADAQKIADFVLDLEPKISLEQSVKDPDKLEKGDVINYNEAQYTVIRPLKNKVFEMDKDGEKFKLSSKDGLYASLIEAKKNPQALERERGEEIETAIAEEETSGYKMKR